MYFIQKDSSSKYKHCNFTWESMRIYISDIFKNLNFEESYDIFRFLFKPIIKGWVIDFEN